MSRINSLYDNTRERLLQATLNWSSLNLLMTAWGFDPDSSFDPTHLKRSDLGTPLAVSLPVLTPNVRPGGYAASSYANFPAIPIGTDVQFVVLEEVAALPADNRLLAYLADVSGLPFMPNGLGYLFKPDWLFSQGWFRA